MKIELRAVKVIGKHLTAMYGEYPIQLYPQKLLFFLSVTHCTKRDILKLRSRIQTNITNLYQELMLFNDRWQFIYHVERQWLWIWTSEINQYFQYLIRDKSVLNNNNKKMASIFRQFFYPEYIYIYICQQHHYSYFLEVSF